jgi:ubiquinone/menaquinone biosynthesis C-methylase UbiE
MKRILEPELMEGVEQVKAYSEADFELGHSKIVQLLDEVFGAIDISGKILDLGCGSGDVTFRIARRFPKAKITAVDGSKVMLRFAEERKKNEVDISERVNFVQAMVPSSDIPKKAYDLILSTSFLHHLHQPDVLWQMIKELKFPSFYLW